MANTVYCTPNLLTHGKANNLPRVWVAQNPFFSLGGRKDLKPIAGILVGIQKV